jgi:inorganic pyrophosphatase
MEINIFVEIPKGSNQKYEYEEDKKRIILDRTLYSSVYFPFEYGFIEGTQSEDGDPLDAVLISSFPTFPGCLVRARAIGILYMEDEGGIDYKIIAVPQEKIDPRFKEIQDINDLSEHSKAEIKEFFEIYKRLEPGKWVKIKDFGSKKEAEEIINKTTINK